MLLGLRGVGKTVLLNQIEEMAEAAGHVTSSIEAPEGKALNELLVPKINQALRKLSASENAKAKAHQGLRALRSFASAFHLSYGDASISVDPEVGVTDSGSMEADLPELFVRVGEAAKAAGKAWTLLIDDTAIREILAKTKGYPYFLQEWGYQCWNIAEGPRITLEDASKAAGAATKRLDEGFFKVRFDRLTPKEREYVIAMAELGVGPYRSSDVADALNETHQSLGPRRAQVISKGMIHSPSHGDIAFTVPMFNDYLDRNYVEKPSKA